MKMRIFMVLLLFLSLMACQRQKAEPDIVEVRQAKDIASNKDATQAPDIRDTADAKPWAQTFKALPINCPASSKRLQNGLQCTCDGEALNSEDALSGWICAVNEWVCYAKEGCRHGSSTCGFGGRLKAGACLCGEQKVKATQLGDYICRNNYWVCANPSGCKTEGADCGYQETCFSPSDTCGKMPLQLDLASYRCENRAWVCRHTKGCLCGDMRIGHGEHCVQDQAYCGTLKKPESGNYRCDGTCDLDETQASYRWVCEDKDGCPCGHERCGFGAYCNDGQCACGVDAPPQDLKDYLCVHDPNSQTYSWLCTSASGCKCGDQKCVLGEACVDGNCQTRAAGFPAHREAYAHQPYGENRWLCNRPEGCLCNENTCAKQQSCIDGRCSCQSDIDCTQNTCEDGFCSDKTMDCNGQEPPKTPGYICENGVWLCDSVHDCLCGGKHCSRGARCSDGQCLCGDSPKASASNAPNILCRDDRWLCQWGALCGGQFCPTDAECRDGTVSCGGRKVEQTQGYLCKENDDGFEWICNAEVCWCGDKLCPEQSLCKDGQCLCGTQTLKESPEVGLQPSQYTCLDKQWRCNGDDCKLCGGRICPARTRCINEKCQCGQRAYELPQDATHYSCTDGNWICRSDACGCGTGKCGRYGTCTNGICRCGNTLAPENAENYICDFLDDIWICNHPSACIVKGKTCKKGEGLVGDVCQKLENIDAFLRMEENANEHIADENARERRAKTNDDPPGDICAGPRGIGSQELCIDDCSGLCNGEIAPRFEGYVCDGFGWVCEKPICVCGDNACSAGNVCVSESYCSKP